jgi:hypothetical protein
MQAETQAARRSGKAFPESTKTVDTYRVMPEPAPGPEPSTPAEDSEKP